MKNIGVDKIYNITSTPIASQELHNSLKGIFDDNKLAFKGLNSNTLFDQIEAMIKKYTSTGEDLFIDLIKLKEIMLESEMLSNQHLDSTTISIDKEYSEEIGRESERLLYEKLRYDHGADRIKWVNQDGESGYPYDFEVLNSENQDVTYIECKGTPGFKPTFYLTDREWSFFIQNKRNYQIWRVFNLSDTPEYFCINNLYQSLMNGIVVPYLVKPEVLKEKRVFLTISDFK